MASRIAYYGSIVTDRLVLLWDVAKKDSYSGSGTFSRDLSDNGFVGYLENGPIFDTEGKVSLIFDGLNDNINFGDILDLGTNDFTITQWVKLTNNPSSQSSLSKSIYTTSNYRYGILYDSTPRVSLFFQGSGGIDVTPHASTVLSLNTWYNITITLDRSSIAEIFINGVRDTLIGSATVSQWDNLDFQSANPFRIGSYTNGDGISSNLNFVGEIGLTYMYFRVLSDEEILRNYDSTKSRFGY